MNEEKEWYGENTAQKTELKLAILEATNELRKEFNLKCLELTEQTAKTQRELDRWNNTAKIIQWVAVATAGTFAALVSVADWIKDHIH